MRQSTVLALLLIATLILVGCGEAAHASDVIEGRTAVIGGTPGGLREAAALGSQYPDLLKKFPVPQGFVLDKGGYATVMQRGDLVAVARWKGSGSISGIVEFYRRSLPRQGWDHNVTFESDRSAQFTYTKDAGQATTVLEKDGNDVLISVAIGRISEMIPTPIPTATPVPTPTRTPAPAAGVVAAGGRGVPLMPAPAATFTPVPLAAGDAATVPAELKEMPVPSGFTFASGSARRVVQGGTVVMAAADWFGTGSPKDVGAFYRGALAKSWNEDSYMESGDDVNAQYTSKKDSALTLLIEVARLESNTVAHLNLVRSR